MVLFHHEYMHLADKVAERYPGLRLVLDHLGLKSGKDVTEATNFATLDKVLALAKRPNVAAKVSAMPCYAADKTYPFRSVHPHIRRVFDALRTQADLLGHRLVAPAVRLPPGRHHVHRGNAVAERRGPRLGHGPRRLRLDRMEDVVLGTKRTIPFWRAKAAPARPRAGIGAASQGLRTRAVLTAQALASARAREPP